MERIVAAAVALLAVALLAVTQAPAAPGPCSGALTRGVIPPWSRAGFTGKAPRLPHAIGRKGEIAALVFGDPLTTPPARNHNNKILWVERRPSKNPTALWIHAQRMAGTRSVGAPVTRVVAVGPSFVNLPTPGCWRLTLSWSGRRDTLDLAYTPRR